MRLLRDIEYYMDSFDMLLTRWRAASTATVDVPLEREHPMGAQGYGLDESQQRFASDLWTWQRGSLHSPIILGGPVDDYSAIADDGRGPTAVLAGSP